MIVEALTWAVRGSIQRSRIDQGAMNLAEFAADVPALMADSPEESAFQWQLAIEAQRSPDLLEQVRATFDPMVPGGSLENSRAACGASDIEERESARLEKASNYAQAHRRPRSECLKAMTSRTR
jgi:hypothetical protein